MKLPQGFVASTTAGSIKASQPEGETVRWRGGVVEDGWNDRSAQVMGLRGCWSPVRHWTHASPAAFLGAGDRDTPDRQLPHRI